jgi:transposase
MRNYNIPQDELLELKVAHKSARQMPSYLAYRIHVIILFGMGMSPSEISEILFLDEDTVVSHFDKYATGGLAALLKTEYKGSKKKLADSQIDILCKELDANIHLTTKSVCRFVKLQFDVEYSERGMSALLNKIGFVYTKPDLVPGKADEDLQDIFLEQFANFLKTKSDNDPVFFMDAVHPVHNTEAAYGWFRKGEKREIKSNTGRSRYNIHGAMNAETLEVTAIFTEDNVNATTTIDLLKALEESHPEADNIYVLLDNAKYHFSSVVQDYVEKTKIHLVPLPPYSPELNLIERFWKFFKKNVLYNTYYPTFDEFKQACLDFFKIQHTYQEQVFSIMGDGLFELM